jgi:hypothetical protein
MFGQMYTVNTYLVDYLSGQCQHQKMTAENQGVQ